MDQETREQVCAAAVRAAKAVDYEGAGTIEFIADASEGLRADRIWFMEMNTRLQVEHPVTEEITGQDLVEWQLRVASESRCPKRQEELRIDGWAMEARLYAEDPANGFLPSIGRLDAFDLGESARVDTGVEQGAEVTPFYDPMIAKVITHAPTRDGARLALAAALDETVVWPVRSNAGFMVKALEHPAFAAGNIDTGLIAREGGALLPAAMPSVAALADVAETFVVGEPLIGFRVNAPAQDTVRMLVAGEPVTVPLPRRTPGPRAAGDALPGSGPRPAPGRLLVAEGGQTWEVEPFRATGAATGGAADGAILSPMPGRVIAVEVAAGDRVAKGQKLLTLEAMKMEHSLLAPFDGTVAELNAEAGGQVSEGKLLARVERDG
jgi:3-methylcrotonyl-CoA carboxylase alpha subunit